MKAKELAELLMTQPDLEILSPDMMGKLFCSPKPLLKDIAKGTDCLYEADSLRGAVLIRRYAAETFKAWILL